MSHNAHPANPRYYPWEIFDAPDSRLHGRIYRKTDLDNIPPSFFPNGTVFQHREKGNLKVFWDGVLIAIQSLDDPVPLRGRQ